MRRSRPPGVGGERARGAAGRPPVRSRHAAARAACSRGAIALLLLATFAALSRTPARALTPLDPRAATVLRDVDSLVRAWRLDTALVLLDPQLTRARARGDRELVMQVQLRRAACLGLTDRAAQSEAAARPAIALAEALGDSAVLRDAVRWLAFSWLTRGQLDESLREYRRLLALSVPAGDARNEGYARTALAYRDLMEGRLLAAREGYRRAVACMERARDPRAMLTPLVGRARTECGLGEYELGRRTYQSIVALARRLDARRHEADALNNLGTLEYDVGDPAAAVRLWNRAVAIYRDLGAAEPMQSSASNAALGEADLGHYDEAARQLEALLAFAVERDFRRDQIQALLHLAGVRDAQGRHEESIRLLRRCLAIMGDREPGYRVEAMLGIADALAGEGRPSEALAVLEREAHPLVPRLSADLRVRLELRVAHLLRATGRTARAYAAFEHAAESATALGLGPLELDALTGAGRCDAESGHPDRARATLARALVLWESQRRVPSDPEWREHRGELAEELCFAFARALLDPARGVPRAQAVADAYDVMQRFKARTLLERMTGPAGSLPRAREPVTLSELQRQVLGEGDLLLDAFVGRQQGWLFAITPREVRLTWLPGGDSLAAQIQLYRELVATPPPAVRDPGLEAVRHRAARRLGQELLGGVADLVTRCRRVILAPDGPLNAIPLGELPLAADGDDAPLLTRRAVVRIPSATLLAELRRRPPAVAERGLLALGGAIDASGRPLPGTADEVRELRRDFRGVDARIAGDPAAVPLRAAELSRYQVLHVAAHTWVDDQRPWNSGLLLGSRWAAPLIAAAGAPAGAPAAGSAAGADREAAGAPWLRAAAIASMRLPARLALLSGCESGGGRIAWGEGVQGLGAAFQSAGVPAVVVTLWPVDDRISAALVRTFYSRLADGETAADALRHAQLDLARRPATAHPFFWAGYVLIGDGEVRVPLHRRFPVPLVLAFAAAALGLIVVWSWSTRSVRRAARPGPPV